jgi:hypothetical protein
LLRRAQEEYINFFPHFKTNVADDDGTKHEIHFMALFSQKEDAIPIAFFHGWPGTCHSQIESIAYLRMH